MWKPFIRSSPRRSCRVLLEFVLKVRDPRGEKTHLSEWIGKTQLGLSVEPERYGSFARTDSVARRNGHTSGQTAVKTSPKLREQPNASLAPLSRAQLLLTALFLVALRASPDSPGRALTGLARFCFPLLTSGPCGFWNHRKRSPKKAAGCPRERPRSLLGTPRERGKRRRFHL